MHVLAAHCYQMKGGVGWGGGKCNINQPRDLLLGYQTGAGLALATQPAFEMNGAAFSAFLLLMRTNPGSLPLG